MVDVVSCLRYGYSYVVRSNKDAVRLIQAANTLKAIEVQVAIPPHVSPKEYEKIVKSLARSNFTRMTIVNPRDDPSNSNITKKLITVTSSAQVPDVEAESGVQYLIAFPDSFPYQRQASIACLAYSRGFLVINGPFATPLPSTTPSRVASFWTQLGKLIHKIDWMSLASATITWMPSVLLLALAARVRHLMHPKAKTRLHYQFVLFNITKDSPKFLRDFVKFLENFTVSYLNKSFSIRASSLDEAATKLREYDFDKLSEASEFKVIKSSDNIEVRFRDAKHLGRFFRDFVVAFVNRFC